LFSFFTLQARLRAQQFIQIKPDPNAAFKIIYRLIIGKRMAGYACFGKERKERRYMELRGNCCACE
jgi:hypothetical protein